MENESGVNYIYVRRGKHTGDERVALFEENPLHPNEDNQAFVYGDKVVKVALTEKVQERLDEGFIEEVRNYREPEKARQENPAPASDPAPEDVPAAVKPSKPAKGE